MQQDRAGAEFRHRACASTFPSPEQNPPEDVKEKKKRKKKSQPEDISWKNEGLEVAFLFWKRNFML